MTMPMMMLVWSCHGSAVLFNRYRKGEITRLTILISLIRMFSEGPEVSLKGSPTVSPTTTALWHSLPFVYSLAS